MGRVPTKVHALEYLGVTKTVCGKPIVGGFWGHKRDGRWSRRITCADCRKLVGLP